MLDDMPMPTGMSDLQDWDRIADRYVWLLSTVGTAEDRIYQQFHAVLWESLGDLRGLIVLDLGCGHDWLSQRFHEAGAAAWGVDGSVALLAHARAAHPEVTFIQHDLVHGLPAVLPTVDRVVANMVLMDIPVLDPIVAAVRAILKPDGRFIFTLPHPCFFNMKVRLDEATGRRYRMVTGYLRPAVWRIENFGGHNHYHRGLTDYVECLRRHGLAVTRLYEPPHIPGPDTPDPDFYRDIPVFLLVEARPLAGLNATG